MSPQKRRRRGEPTHTVSSRHAPDGGPDSIGIRTGEHGVIAGKTRTGKTHYLVDMILGQGVHKGLAPGWDKVVVMCDTMSVGQPTYARLKKDFKGKGGVTFVKGLPIDQEEEQKFIDMLSKAHNNKHKTICIIDDLMNDTKSGHSERFCDKLFTSARHLGVDTWEINQSHCANRNRRLNAGYLVFFKTPADVKSLQTVGSQIRPDNKGRDVIAAYRQATSTDHGCLLVCLHENERYKYRNTDPRVVMDLTKVRMDEHGNLYTSAVPGTEEWSHMQSE